MKQQWEKDYSRLAELSRQSALLNGITALLDWDQETYMPAGAAAIRSEQLKILALLAHKAKTGAPFRTALSRLIDIDSGDIAQGPGPAEKAALKRWRHDYVRVKALPSKLVEELTKLSSQAIHIWRLARQRDAFLQFAPVLDRLITLCRRKADYLGFQNHPYDALVEDYEPGMTTALLKNLFDSLVPRLQQMVKAIQSQPIPEDSFLKGPFNEKAQILLCHKLMELVGYEANKGRLDLSTHPFSSSSHPTDSRITTRISKDNLMESLSATMHECGHSLYEMGLPESHFGTPLGQAVSLGIHESQSRFWETFIGQSEPFSHFLLTLLQDHFSSLKEVKPQAFYRAINKVSPGLIRIDSDEVTYNLHIALRFNLEVQLIEGSLKVRDLPDAWNSQMQELLGITPSNNQEGCLQDIHWSMGSFGYFPTYTLGNLYAGQLFAAFAKGQPHWKEGVQKGELLFIRDWLKEKIHQHGRRYTPLELIESATGKTFSSEPYLAYLEGKYLGG